MANGNDSTEQDDRPPQGQRPDRSFDSVWWKDEPRPWWGRGLDFLKAGGETVVDALSMPGNAGYALGQGVIHGNWENPANRPGNPLNALAALFTAGVAPAIGGATVGAVSGGQQQPDAPPVLPYAAAEPPAMMDMIEGAEYAPTRPYAQRIAATRDHYTARRRLRETRLANMIREGGMTPEMTQRLTQSIMDINAQEEQQMWQEMSQYEDANIAHNLRAEAAHEPLSEADIRHNMDAALNNAFAELDTSEADAALDATPMQGMATGRYTSVAADALEIAQNRSPADAFMIVRSAKEQMAADFAQLVQQGDPAQAELVAAMAAEMGAAYDIFENVEATLTAASRTMQGLR